ncbi:FliH/SctL family protein [Actinophytocola sp.]|uniref:FliH/SctL family protein n=1 Tax=Actinophytocola sp. TaxID=1872138 RepID=UPI002D802C1C|nr:FliH/SctL family protein [Actinophytocola sp.]HET9143757.1 FliH/SctL family protein [Actinophytocola sp.]
MTEWGAAVVVPREKADTAVPYQLTTMKTGTPVKGSPRNAARDEGYAIGWAQGMREARESTIAARQRAERELEHTLRQRDERVERAMAAMSAAAGRIREITVQRSEELSELILAAAIDLAEAIVGAELSADVLGATRTAVARALAQLPAGPAVIVRLNPEDLAELTDAGDLPPSGAHEVTFVADPEVARGDAVAQNKVSTVEATVSGALQRVRAELVA